MINIVSKPNLCIVVPCYNEEEVLLETVSRLTIVLKDLILENKISKSSTILFVDDGSKDSTWLIIEELSVHNCLVKGLKLARNAGHQYALLAGLQTAGNRADIVISIDADLQDDINAIKEFVLKYHEGYEIVYGVRQRREKDSLFKKYTAQGFYRIMKMMGVNIVYNHADYRLMSRRAINHLLQFREVNLFLRGIIPLIGFKSTHVYYDRHARYAGVSKYPLKKMLAFAFEGITSFSTIPIRIVTFTGFSLFFVSILAAFVAIAQKLLGQTVTGWASLIISIWFIGGVQLMCMGLVGEYIGKIYKEVKNRPKYIIDKDLFSSETNIEVENKVKIPTI